MGGNKFLLCVSFISIALATDPPTIFSVKDRYKMVIGKEQEIFFPRATGEALHVTLGSSLYKTDGAFTRCINGLGDMDLCVQWGQYVVNVTVIDDNCQVIQQLDPQGNANSDLTSCFEYGDEQWFGGSERWYQNWPVQTVNIDNKPFLTGYDSSQSVAEPLWITSSGTSIFVNERVPLFLDSNQRQNGTLCLIARIAEPYIKRERNILQYEVCQWGDPVTAQKNATARYYEKPTGRPRDEMFREPIYSTWVRYGRNINQDILMELVQEIRNNSFPVGQIEIDDTWEKCYGSWEFDIDRFPNITGFTSYVHSLGGRVTAWAFPFINRGCDPSYQEGLEKNYYIRSADGNTTMQWWCGTGGAIDFTNEDAANWWVERTRNLISNSGMDSLKFDAGETTYLPPSPQLSADPELVPNIYIRKYIDAVSNFKGYMEVRVARNTQDLPAFVRMLDKDSRFGLDNGLQSVLTTLFQMNMVGYPFVLPDMIGGNAYGNKITKELFIRWLQASVFMPSLQFSVVPWDFDAETVEISRKYLALHSSYSTLIIAAADKAVAEGTPINTPIWWLAPTDIDALKCRDEYLLSEKILVAPVVEEGAVQRDIYLPAGNWLDANQMKTIAGPTWLKNYSAPIDILPYFIKQ